ncbi:MAG: hypothetical protein G3I10_01270 [Ferrovum sp.]|nr:hypothetical protein [Ferrovum sp.]
MATNPLVSQGTLNRVRCSVVVPAFSSLNITSSFMGKSFATIEFEEPFAEQIKTGTGVVISPEPYVMAKVTVGLLRTQSLASAWLTQAQSASTLGDLYIHSDTSAFPAIYLAQTIIQDLNPGAYDGTDPVSKLILRGVYYVNNDLWNMV